MEELILYLITFMAVYLIYYLFVIKKNKKNGKFKTSSEVIYLEKKYHINILKIGENKLIKVVVFANSFIIATTVSFISVFNNLITQVLVGFSFLFIIIIFVYHIIGKYYQRKKWENE